ncbi:MAG: hypothetical protein ACD_67C00165G0002 [uncultured bacterium]|nr:MAG: hypothetical protein ACD_67C00165G0002 [uncultured bacterium]
MIQFPGEINPKRGKGEKTMATKAIDMATIMKALWNLRQGHAIGHAGWQVGNENQRKVFDLFERYFDEIICLNDIDCTAKVEGARIIVEAILDKSVKWLDGIAKDETIKIGTVHYPAFKLKKGCTVFKVEGFECPLLVIETKSGDNLWLMMTEKQLEGMELVRKAFEIVEGRRLRHPEYITSSDAIIPKIDFNLKPDIGFLVGASTFASGVNWVIDEARQEFKFRMNEEGARAVVKTSLGVLGCCVSFETKKEVITIDKPFIGFFTQKNSGFPLAIFYSDFDSWKSVGKLRAL